MNEPGTSDDSGLAKHKGCDDRPAANHKGITSCLKLAAFVVMLTLGVYLALVVISGGYRADVF